MWLPKEQCWRGGEANSMNFMLLDLQTCSYLKGRRLFLWRLRRIGPGDCAGRLQPASAVDVCELGFRIRWTRGPLILEGARSARV